MAEPDLEDEACRQLELATELAHCEMSARDRPSELPAPITSRRHLLRGRQGR
jgi:hypothetical protein